MVVVPAFNAVTTPEELTVATVASLLVQVIVALPVFPEIVGALVTSPLYMVVEEYDTDGLMEVQCSRLA